jgi:hypothetical protein
MPVLNYHRDVKDMPDMSKLQKCDTCGVEQIGNRMYYANPTKREIEVICRSCFLQTRRPTKRSPDAGDSAASTSIVHASAESASEGNA